METEKEVFDEIIGGLLKVKDEFLALLEKDNPDMVPLYSIKLQKALDPTEPEQSRLLYALEIYSAYILLKQLHKPQSGKPARE